MKTKTINAANVKFVTEFFGAEILKQNTEKTETTENRFGGRKISVTPLVKKLIDFVYELSEAFETGRNVAQVNKALTQGNAVQKFDRARYLVLEQDGIAYSEVLD